MSTPLTMLHPFKQSIHQMSTTINKVASFQAENKINNIHPSKKQKVTQ